MHTSNTLVIWLRLYFSIYSRAISHKHYISSGT